jgi:hypothetical protein
MNIYSVLLYFAIRPAFGVNDERLLAPNEPMKL